MTYPLSIAPMMDRTDRHFRYFMRQITKYTLLYTEMVTTAAIIHGDRSKLLDFSPEEKPLSLQLGGDDPQILAECALIGEDWGYDEINLNVGCPSERVQSGNFGACLMAQPELVAKAVEKMQSCVRIPVTVKHRIGIDNQDSYQDLANFVKIVSEAGCQRFTVHARKAWLKGLSPKENRTIPPLRYEEVYQLKKDFPHLFIEINGGITTLEQVKQHLTQVDGVMIGRAAYDRPYLFATVDQEIFGQATIPPTRHQVINKMLPYIDTWVTQGGRLHSIMRHVLEIFAGQTGTKAWKRYIS
ncbi:MAG: tRNA dihydrouridine(20/20a) synthase DusA, partial [Microcystaceae cyanobacterium]